MTPFSPGRRRRRPVFNFHEITRRNELRQVERQSFFVRNTYLYGCFTVQLAILFPIGRRATRGLLVSLHLRFPPFTKSSAIEPIVCTYRCCAYQVYVRIPGGRDRGRCEGGSNRCSVSIVTLVEFARPPVNCSCTTITTCRYSSARPLVRLCALYSRRTCVALLRHRF